MRGNIEFMRETQQEQTGQGQGQSNESTRFDQGTGAMSMVLAMLARLPSIADIANVIRQRPGERGMVLQLLQQMLGNGFVQQVIAALVDPAAPAADTAAAGTSAAASSPATSAAGTPAAQPSAVGAPARVRVTAPALNVRATPGVEPTNVIGGLHRSQIVVVTERHGEWLGFDYQGRVGYIYGHYVEPVPAGTEAATDPGSSTVGAASQPTQDAGGATHAGQDAGGATHAGQDAGGASQPTQDAGGATHAAQDAGGQPAGQQAAPPADHTAIAPSTDEWVSSAPAPDAAGEQKYSNTKATKGQIFDAITQVAPGLPYELRVMLLGQAWLEQQGKNIINNNFAGMEGGSASYVMARTSAVITRAEYEANPSKYSDWGKGNVYGGKDAGTIEVQLARGETKIVVMTRKKRPAYASLASAAAAYVHNVEAKFHKLQASPDPAHQALVEQALGGDAHAYARIISLSAPKLGIYPYNPDIGYPARVIAQIELARNDLADRAPASP